MSPAPVMVSVALGADTIPVGRLWAHVSKGRERATFQYDEAWLRHPSRFALQPALRLDAAPHHTGQGKALFGALGDSAPDRWGRTLLHRAERERARREGRAPRQLYELDILLGVSDIVRQGALRFQRSADGPYLAIEGDRSIPPMVDLPRLASAAARVLDDDEAADDLALLLAPGSSLGGARPKAVVRESDGSLWIAKFSTRHDDYDMARAEALTLTLARQAGLVVPDITLLPLGDATALLVRRFDRKDGQRIPFLSAMSLLDARDGETRSYLEIADALRSHSAAAAQDLRELWSRIVFTVLVSNTDDHLRNHGVCYAGSSGWRLSPLYDVNPTPVELRPRRLSTAIDEVDVSASLTLALSVAESFGLTPDAARARAQEIAAVTAQWRDVAARVGLSARDTARISSAFEHGEGGRIV
jgi:serine/threonine-protein kinase HipA